MNTFTWKVHYFLWYAGLAGILPYYAVFVKTYTATSAISIGTLFAILPFTAFILNPLFCSLADKQNNHRQWLLCLMCLTMLTFGSLIALPWMNFRISWIVASILLLIAYPSMAAAVSITDAIVMQKISQINMIGSSSSPSQSPEAHKVSSQSNFGNTRVWGTIGYGLFGIVTGPLNDKNKIDLNLPYLVPGIIMFILIMIADLIVIIIGPYHEAQADKRRAVERTLSTSTTIEVGSGSSSREERKKMLQVETTEVENSLHQDQASILNSIFTEYPSLLQHCFALTILGILMACHWSFFYWYLEEVAGKDPLLMGLCMFVGCFLGEMIFFYYGSQIVKRFGPSRCFEMSMIAFAFQYFSYSYLIHPGYQYYVLFLEVLQGPTFGLLYCAMTHLAHDYSDDQHAITQATKQVHSSLQGILTGCLEGLGLGLGSFFAGFLIHNFGSRVMWTCAGSLALVSLSINLCFDAIRWFARDGD
ncbi:major facilitator superfamily domain-containing protein 6-like isoform X2 [Brevipalpus obovatus]|uniref:major facilitator superfamily domain-containing protein 6-like isoform X2 n=1 Tax=Brevipalpus obovatus TaxID=246614 RepID=UPI003D9DC467